MNEMNNRPTLESVSEQLEQRESALPVETGKKQFVEPVVSVPVDVLEATSFFQVASSLDTSDV